MWYRHIIAIKETNGHGEQECHSCTYIRQCTVGREGGRWEKNDSQKCPKMHLIIQWFDGVLVPNISCAFISFWLSFASLKGKCVDERALKWDGVLEANFVRKFACNMGGYILFLWKSQTNKKHRHTHTHIRPFYKRPFVSSAIIFVATATINIIPLLLLLVFFFFSFVVVVQPKSNSNWYISWSANRHHNSLRGKEYFCWRTSSQANWIYWSLPLLLFPFPALLAAIVIVVVVAVLYIL